jgi:hypothetical protein
MPISGCALLVPSCCDKLGTNCYNLVIQVVPTRLITCYLQTISDLLEQLVASLQYRYSVVYTAVEFIICT